MIMYRNLPRLFTALLLLGFSLATLPARAACDAASLTTSFNNLVTQGNSLVVTLKSITLSPSKMSSQLATIETAVLAYEKNVNTVYTSVATSVGTDRLSLSEDMLTTLATLSQINVVLATILMDNSQSIVALASTTYTTTLQSSLASMLRLSDDIGAMANRILEMADKILIMADNIGLMANRILETQRIQSVNLKLVVDAIMQTQTNIISVIVLYKL